MSWITEIHLKIFSVHVMYFFLSFSLSFFLSFSLSLAWLILLSLQAFITLPLQKMGFLEKQLVGEKELYGTTVWHVTQAMGQTPSL